MFITNPDFSRYTVLAEPCATYESRVFHDPDNTWNKCGTTYGSYSLKLARDPHSSRGSYVILIQHGGGREALSVTSVYGAEKDWLETITDERRLYAALWSLYKTADSIRAAARQETAGRYAQAFVDGRLKKRRKGGRVYVDFAQPAILEPEQG